MAHHGPSAMKTMAGKQGQLTRATKSAIFQRQPANKNQYLA
jgi:hypothetical protein